MSEDPEQQAKVAQFQQFMQAQQVQAQLAEVLSRLTETCWDKCNPSISRSLSSSEQACMANCAARYLDVSLFVMQRISKQSK